MPVRPRLPPSAPPLPSMTHTLPPSLLSYTVVAALTSSNIAGEPLPLRRLRRGSAMPRSAPARRRTPPSRPPRNTPACACTRRAPRSTPGGRAGQATRRTVWSSASGVSANTDIRVAPPRLRRTCDKRRGRHRPGARRLCPSGPRSLTRALSSGLFANSGAAVADLSLRKGAPPPGSSSISACLPGTVHSPWKGAPLSTRTIVSACPGRCCWTCATPGGCPRGG